MGSYDGDFIGVSALCSIVVPARTSAELFSEIGNEAG